MAMLYAFHCTSCLTRGIECEWRRAACTPSGGPPSFSIRCMSAGSEAGQGKALEALSSVQRSAPERAAFVRWDPSGSVLACQSAGRSIELYRSVCPASRASQPTVSTWIEG